MTRNKPFFSIILPVYNRAKYIAEAINSVLQQTEQDWELIIIDDCSTDQTPEILESFSRRFSKIRVLKNSKNLNIAATANRGIEEACGDWMVRLDSDDRFTSDYLRILRFWIEAKEMDTECFFSSWVSIIDEGGSRVLDVELPDARTIRRMMPIENFLYNPATIFSKLAWQKVGGYPTGDRTMADATAVWLKFFQAGMKLVMIPRHLVCYRVHYSNITSVHDKRLTPYQKDAEKKALQQYREWRVSLFLKQERLKDARHELQSLWNVQKRITLKNLQYYFLTYLPRPMVHSFMWEFRPRLRSLVKDISRLRVPV